MNLSKTHVAIIGGGCAGLSAAATLVDQGYKVTVFEASSQLGGRARTVVVENNDLMHLLDNGQHILLGAYRETLSLLHKIGVDEKKVFMRLPLRMNMQSMAAQLQFSLKAAHYLPAPLNMLIGLFFCKGLSLSERIEAVKLMARLKKMQYQVANDMPLNKFLINQYQTSKLITMLWEPLCLAALNTPIKEASTRVFLNVLRDTFTGNKKNSDFLLPRLDLSKIISQPLSQYIQARDGVIKLNRRIRSLEIAKDGVGKDGFNLETRDGKSFFSHVVIAVSPARVEALLEELPKLKYALAQTQTYTYQPIYTIYLQYPSETKLPSVMTGMTDGISQWVFDRGQLCGQKGLIAVIVSAEGKHQKLTQDDLALRIARELSHAFPELTKPLWHKVIAEKRATFSCVANLARPTNKTLQPKLFLAGDYTYADYPATIEGSIRSGIKCAELIFNT
ncbi:MAG TPA: hydroxysqualene dehydroxylase HpnE [Methylotenera sp.]|nr:hydroxysqualene dehydroxylase HpnE [Methylotenera sp.]